MNLDYVSVQESNAEKISQDVSVYYLKNVTASSKAVLVVVSLRAKEELTELYAFYFILYHHGCHTHSTYTTISL